MKSKRQEEILALIQEQNIETQNQLIEALRKRGVKSTQATLSRDIRELRLVKELSPDGGYRYTIPAREDSGDQLDETTRTQLLENIRDESNWLVSVVENLLSVTRMTGEQTKIKKEMEAGEEVLSAAAMKIKKHYPDIDVSVHAPQELLMIPMDVILIEQVLINLMENAIQHGGTTTRVELQLRKDGERARFEVADDGQGIAREVFPKLFKGYLSHDEGLTADGRRNMGIGLSVCMSIVQAHGGTMQAENRETGGALFSFTLPLEEHRDENPRENSGN